MITLHYIDTETTGLGPSREVVEVAVLRVDYRPVIEPGWGTPDAVAGYERLDSASWASLVAPVGGQDSAAVEVHGLTSEVLSGAPAASEIGAILARKLSGDRIIAGHNIAFDLVALANSFPALDLSGHDVLDTYRYVRMSLARAADHYGLPRQEHRALSDAQLTALLLEKYLEMNCITLEALTAPHG